jgi:hypothetical protein
MTDFTRRDLLIGGTAVLATATLPVYPNNLRRRS